MKAFLVSGHFKMGHNQSQPFRKEFPAADEAGARERALSDLGSRHGVKRLRIHIETVQPISGDDVNDPVVQFRVKQAQKAKA